ncbi:MAG: hypothetical protein DRI84_05690 [Bacteroidetes bacterium]|nr:MAG: hypothetical protein DRI84_05690 [Bacteroidota bacterium]
MKLNWKDSFKEESNNRLFEIFSEKNRINIDPQIFAGNLLFERKYDLELLKTAKKELIESIEDAFIRKYNTEPKKIRKENLVRELVLRTLLAIIVFGIFYNSSPLSFNLFSLTIDNKTIALILGLASFLPLFWLKKSNEKAIEKVEKEKEKKINLTQKINTELRF